MDFPAAFRQHVMPDLRFLCIAHGSSIAHGLESFSEGHARVMRCALDRGGSYLPAELLVELEDHLLTTLCNAAVETEAKLKSLGV